MRTDLFTDRKSVHIKLSKEVHFALRAKLFKHNISMQELFDEFARLVAEDTIKGQSVINSIVSRKVGDALSGKKRKKKKEVVNNFDSETLYNLINGTNGDP